MTALADCAIAFFGGGFSEACCLFWVNASERGKAGRAAVFSMLYAIAIERGVGEAIHTHAGEIAFVLGFGFGTWASVRWLARGQRNR